MVSNSGITAGIGRKRPSSSGMRPAYFASR